MACAIQYTLAERTTKKGDKGKDEIWEEVIMRRRRNAKAEKGIGKKNVKEFGSKGK